MNKETHLADPIPAGCIRSMKVDELKEYFQYIKRDFAKDEYPPYHVLSYQLKEGIQQGFVYTGGYPHASNGTSHGIIPR